MSDKTKIEWSDATWNPITGCTKVSEGCRNCYAMTFAERWRGTTGHYFENGFDITLRPDKLVQPLKWKEPRKIFVNSMSDLFHKNIPDGFIDQVFGVMLACYVFVNRPNHTFQILTKRPERMMEYLTSSSPSEMLKRWASAANGIASVDNPDMLFSDLVYSSTCHDWDDNGRNSSGSEYIPWHYTSKLFPLPNVWLGVSVENQKAADERIPLLLQTPAAVRFLSCEPLLGPVNLNEVPRPDNAYFRQRGEKGCITDPNEPDDYVYWHKRDQINWVIVGGESGHKARPMHPDWVRSIRDQCQAAGVPFFFKQWGEWAVGRRMSEIEIPGILAEAQDGIITLTTIDPPRLEGKKTFVAVDREGKAYELIKVGKKAAGRILDGREWDEMPVRGVNTDGTR